MISRGQSIPLPPRKIPALVLRTKLHRVKIVVRISSILAHTLNFLSGLQQPCAVHWD